MSIEPMSTKEVKTMVDDFHLDEFYDDAEPDDPIWRSRVEELVSIAKRLLIERDEAR